MKQKGHRPGAVRRVARRTVHAPRGEVRGQEGRGKGPGENNEGQRGGKGPRGWVRGPRGQDGVARGQEGRRGIMREGLKARLAVADEERRSYEEAMPALEEDAARRLATICDNEGAIAKLES